ncbi:hypothetical protein AYI69_g9594 [Smittium culicis]|uniref:Uncharacterized protein n=1 Tax=Smittium culicis TaxID=133412 RepID=A0A1R1XBM2_9FUNG|nr:hypothetical protein AYI69_g9594 [Smittium culicis]
MVLWSSHTSSIRTIRDTTGIKKPPASSIAMIMAESNYEISSSPIEIKKDHVIFDNNQSDSEGNNTPSEHSMMTGKARLGLITQKINQKRQILGSQRPRAQKRHYEEIHSA